MTTIYRENVCCKNCGQISEQSIIGSTNTFGSPDLDLRPPEMKRSTMNTWLQFCPHCGFCAPDLTESDGDLSIVESPEYRAILSNQKFPELSRRFLVRAILLADIDSASAAHSRLCAAWACDDAKLDELAIECRLAVATDAEKSKPFEDSEAGLTQGAILVDVLRRAGQFERAASECSSLLGYRSVGGILKQVLEFQQQLISTQDRAVHRVSEVQQRA